MRNYGFTKRKFLDFPIERQHKKCAELLRISYEKKVFNNSAKEELKEYEILAGWMDLPPLYAGNCQLIADRYHQHARSASLYHKEHNLLPQARQGDKNISEQVWDISIYLDNIRSAHNVGSIIRTVEAFALGSIHFSKSTPSASHKQVQNTAMGTDKWVQCFDDASLQDLPRPIIALETFDLAIPLYNFIFPETFTLVIGNEEYGCSENTLKIADVILEIPLRGRKNSLNVANAFAIVANEISRQKSVFHHKQGKACSES
jgi:tRNA G18 (ribose-2'-O)-methylase SpoU